jgi:D-glycero-D-manno-heptose 1,7-bisphosphate phosphatase
MNPAKAPAVFLDRDGVINEGSKYYVLKYEDFHFLPGVLEAIAMLSKAGYPPIITTNQSCVSKDLISMRDVEDIHQRMHEEIKQAGGNLTDIMICPHHDEDNCQCRKPKPGMLLQSAMRHDLSLSHSVYAGDRLHDFQAARAAGCHFLLIGEEDIPEEEGEPDRVEDTLLEAVPWILRTIGRECEV